MTTKVLQKVIWAGANNGSYPLAAAALEQLSELRLSTKQIRRLVTQIGEARLAEREQAVEQLKTMPLPKRRAGSGACDPPELAVISMDGGRYQRRDNFRTATTAPTEGTHWRETKVGCLLSMKSEVSLGDPSPRLPAHLATSAVVAELAKIAEKTATSAADKFPDQASGESNAGLPYKPPQLISREVIASSHDATTFGWELEARAWQLGFPAASRQAFVADGLPVNWTIAQRHFPHAEPILDLMHALSYAWSAAIAIDAQDSYHAWAEWIWQGEVRRVITALEKHQQVLGLPPPEAEPSDPRLRVHRALTYYQNNQSRMNYPDYRRRGLPLTSSHIESTVKQINQRIKGSEKFWSRDTGDAVLQLRADCLSDSQPMESFWHRWQANQNGVNCYHAAA